MTQSTGVETQNITFNSADYPRVYTYSKKDRRDYALFGLALCIAAIGIYYYFPFIYTGQNASEPRTLITAIVLFFGLGSIIYPSTTRLILGPDSIEKRSLFISRQKMKRQNIAGYEDDAQSKVMAVLMETSPRLVPVDSYAPRLSIGGFETDEFFEKWYKSLPHFKTAWKSATNRLSFIEKIRVYFRPRILFEILLIVAFVCPFAWIPPFSNAALVLILLLLPLYIVLALKKPNIFSFYDPSYRSFLSKSGLPRIDLGPAYDGTLILLTIWFVKHELYSFTAPYLWTSWFIGPAVITVFLALLSGSLVPVLKNRGISFSNRACILIVTSFLILSISAIALTALLNVRFDLSAPVIYQTTVISKEKSDPDHAYLYGEVSVKADKELKKAMGKSESPYKFLLVATSPRLYKNLKKGDPICIYSYEGLLNLPWVRTAECPDTATPRKEP